MTFTVKPLVDALFVYLKQHESEVGTEKLRAAFTYALNQEKYLRVFLTDGDVPMDNNASERAIRGFCVGKKNWQMIDTINGAKSSAIIYSIAETAKANNLKPYEYFEYLLTEIPKHMDDTDRSFLNDRFRGRKNCQRISENRRIKRSRESGFSLTRYLLWCVYMDLVKGAWFDLYRQRHQLLPESGSISESVPVRWRSTD